VLFAFRNLPLEKIHHSALLASEAATCAARQGHFWEMHDALFVPPAKFDADGLGAAAQNIGLNVEAFQDCLFLGDTTATVRREEGEASKLGINSTPTFLIGKLQEGGEVMVKSRLRGGDPVAKFREIIDGLLQGGG
jgi:protein-disulfide isomerase